jgi:hypothetical protein
MNETGKQEKLACFTEATASSKGGLVVLRALKKIDTCRIATCRMGARICTHWLKAASKAVTPLHFCCTIFWLSRLFQLLLLGSPEAESGNACPVYWRRWVLPLLSELELQWLQLQ